MGYCRICGDEINGYRDYPFCKYCYNTFKDEIIYVKFENLFDDELLYEEEIIDYVFENYQNPFINKNILNNNFLNNRKFMCKDGHIVKSKAEREIDNYLYDNNIIHAYEKPLPIDENPKNDLHPDFYLPQLNIYIEHWGLTDNKEYEEQKQYKLNIYKKLKINLIETTENDMQDIETNLTRKIKFFNKKEFLK